MTVTDQPIPAVARDLALALEDYVRHHPLLNEFSTRTALPDSDGYFYKATFNAPDDHMVIIKSRGPEKPGEIIFDGSSDLVRTETKET